VLPVKDRPYRSWADSPFTYHRRTAVCLAAWKVDGVVDTTVSTWAAGGKATRTVSTPSSHFCGKIESGNRRQGSAIVGLMSSLKRGSPRLRKTNSQGS
jgi:hypothetical protein